MTATTPVHTDAERADLLAMLAKHRYLLRHTTRDLTDEQARARTTDSELCLGGLIKHVAHIEAQWAQFILRGPAPHNPGAYEEFAASFRLLPEETLAGVLAGYAEVAARTDELIGSLPDLNATQPLPQEPWFEPGESWSARRVLMHIVAETAQHAGHADIIRESLDGAKSMG